jgi:hypothetical protein
MEDDAQPRPSTGSYRATLNLETYVPINVDFAAGVALAPKYYMLRDLFPARYKSN